MLYTARDLTQRYGSSQDMRWRALRRSAKPASLDLTGPVLGGDPYMYMYHMYIRTYFVEALTYNQFVRLNLKLYDHICHFETSPAKG